MPVPGPDHDHRCVAVRGRAEGGVRRDEDPGGVPDREPVGEERRADAAARPPAARVAHGGDGQRDPARRGQRARRDRVRPVLQRAQQRQELLHAISVGPSSSSSSTSWPHSQRSNAALSGLCTPRAEVAVRRPPGQLVEQVLRRRGDLHVAQQHLVQRAAGDVVLRVGAEALDERADQGRVVGGEHAQRVARRVGQVRVVEGELVVPDVLGRPRARQQPAHREHRRVRVLPGPLRLLLRRRLGDRAGRGRGGGGAVEVGEHGQGLGDPGGGRVVVVDVAVHPVDQAAGAELLEAGVDVLARLAEVVVPGVAERQHGELQALQPGHGVLAEAVPEQLGAVGHLPLAVRGADDEDPPHRGHLVDGHVAEALERHRHALRLQRAGEVVRPGLRRCPSGCRGARTPAAGSGRCPPRP